MFIDARRFDFVPVLQTAWIEIRDECLAGGPTAFEPWVQREMYGEGWAVYGLVAFGTQT